MKLAIQKGIVSIEGTTKEAVKIDKIANALESTEELEIVEGQAEGTEYWVQLTYDHRDHTVEDMKQLYREAKKL